MADFFDELVFSQDDIITFPEGIPGFEGRRPFVVVATPQFDPFAWLVCVDGSRLRFAIINPLIFVPDYSPKLPKDLFTESDIGGNPNDLVLYTIVTLRENPLESTANLAAPIFINKVKKRGRQIITDDERYSTQELIVRQT